jgi:hypothetical protein
MKKISAVLLVLVLVGSVAFAGFTGSANVDFAYDLDSTDYGFENGTSASIDVKLFEAIGATKGEGDIYADIEASLTFSFSNADEGDLDAAGAPFAFTLNDSNEELIPLYVTFSFDHAKIVGENWSVGILGVLDAPNFATSAIDSIGVADSANDWGYLVENDDVYADLDASEILSTTDGIEVMYMDYTLGFGLTGNVDAGTYNIYGALTTPEFDLADGLKVSFGAAGFMSDTDKAASASAKAAFATDDYSASVAADMVYDNEEIDADVALAAAYDIYTFDAYYATQAMYDGAFAAPAVENLLSAEVGFTVDVFTITLTGLDLINAQDLSASVAWAVNDALTVTVDGGYVIDAETMSFGGLVKYVADAYTATAEVDVTIDAAGDADLELDFDVETTTLIDGATLYAGYYAENMLTLDNLGKITVGVEIEF